MQEVFGSGQQGKCAYHVEQLGISMHLAEQQGTHLSFAGSHTIVAAIPQSNHYTTLVQGYQAQGQKTIHQYIQVQKHSGHCQ